MYVFVLLCYLSICVNKKVDTCTFVLSLLHALFGREHPFFIKGVQVAYRYGCRIIREILFI